MYAINVSRRRAVSDDVVKRNMAACAHLPVYALPGQESGSVAVCAAGPSLLNEMEVIRSLYRVGVPICAVKGVANVLIEQGIIPRYAVFMDAQESQARFLENPHPDVEYLVCSQSDPSVFKALEGFKVTVWHGQCQDFAQSLVNVSNEWAAYIHGPTTGVAAMNLMRSKGYGPLNLFGFDCSYGQASHVYDRHQSKVLDVSINGRLFKTSMAMVDQHNFLMWLFLNAPDLNLRVYGDGALQHAVKIMSQPNVKVEDFHMLVPAPLPGFEEKDCA